MCNSYLARTFLFLVLCSYSNPHALASLLAYEGFNYPNGSGLTNASAASAGDSFGWTNRWFGANKSLATNVASSLLYSDAGGNALLTDGGKLQIGVPAGTTGDNAQPSRNVNIGTPNASGVFSGLVAGTYYVSFMMQWVGQQTVNSTTNLYTRKGDLAFRSGTTTNLSGGSELVAVGRPNASSFPGTPYDTWTLWSGGDGGAATTSVATSYPLNTPTFVLMRLEVDGTAANDTIYLWLNWTNLTSEPPLAAANATNALANLTGINNIRLDANNAGTTGTFTNAVLWFDEFRLGTVFSDVVPLAGASQLPLITGHPVNRTATEGTSVSFSVTAIGDPTLHYQWYFNTNAPVGSDTNWLTFSSASNNNAGYYFVIVTNGSGSATSLVASLTVVPPVPATILTPPAGQTAVVGDPITLAVTATGTTPLRYQWYFNTTTPLTGQTNAALTLTAVTTNDAGSYSVIVTNLYGAATSSIATLTVIPAFERLPAFPGADGAARYVTGGRGGTVYHVTKLDRNYTDSSAGTLRYGLTSGNFPAGPRTIVFDVGGVFWLGRYGTERPEYDNGWDTQSRYNIPSDVTLAGQTAPGPVIIMGGTTKPGGNNIILRNLTFAVGYGMKSFNEPDSVPPKAPTPGDFPDSIVYDALDISGQNVMLDHLTTVYGTDETISCNELAANLTIQYCTIAQGQNYPQADAENPGVYTGHALGSLLQAGSNARISILNNLYAHLKGRLPRVGSEVGTGALNDFRNNVFYNWFGTAGSGASGQPSFNNFINNFYLAGPGGDDVSGTNITTGNSGGTGIFSGASSSATRAYVSGNLKDTNKDGDPNNTASADGDYSSISSQSAAYSVNLGVTLSAPTGFTNVLHYAGARWWARPYDFMLGNTNAITTNDIAAYVDERLIKETFTGTGKIMAWADDPFNSSAGEGIEWRSLLALRADSNTYSAPFNRPANWDTDGDGMPDSWELEHGLNPNVANNNGDFDNDGYTDLEEYLNDLAAWPAPGVITFNNNTNNRYAEIFNWSVAGVTVNIAGTNTVTSSRWQPSRYDTAIISNLTCYVDAVGQHAGTLWLTNSATLNITNGWLSVSNKFENKSGCTVCVLSPGGLRVTNSLVNAGTMLLSGNATLYVGGTFTNTGTLDLMTWNGTLPVGFVNTGTVLDHSLVKLTSPAVSGANFTAAIQGYAKHSYQLQYRDDLAGGNWQNIGSAVNGSNAPINFTHTAGATAAQRFYRVMVNP
ncbi:MAG: hypothetical protein EPO07_12285 [Verrucomicrobia bacterium]|nr:MAG: hypothetical protein EPO07_12285 [Verrucomicrobiota bacterium]